MGWFDTRDQSKQEKMVMVPSGLGAVLSKRRDELVGNWTSRTMQASRRYRERPPEEIRRNLDALLEAIIQLIETGDQSPIQKVVDRVTESMAQFGFAFEDTLGVIFSGIQECIRAIKDECDVSGHSADCFQLVDQLLNAFSRVTTLHAESMEEIRSKSYAAIAISDIADAYSSMNERAIIDRAAESIHNSFALDVALAIKGEAENLFSCRCDDPAIESHLEDACEKALQTGERISLDPNPSEDDRKRPIPTITAIPIRAEREVLGALSIASTRERHLSPYDIRMVESIAGCVGAACENSRLYLRVSDAADKISAERSQMFSVLSGMEASVYVADMDTHEILAVNRMLEKRFGNGLVGRRCYEVLQSGQSGPCEFCTNDRLMEDGQPAGPYSWKFRNTVTGRWYRCIDRAIMWPDGKYVRLELAFDITETEQGRLELENVKNLLELYNDLLLHDLGNFAGTSLAYIDLAVDNTAPEDRSMNFLVSARGQVAKCGQLINKVARFSRALTAADDVRETVDLNGVLDETIGDVVEMLPGSKPFIKIVYEPEPHNVKVGAFAKDIFLNLLLNAVKFGEGKDVDVMIVDDMLRGVPAWKVSILDRGPGVPPELRERLFKRYSRLERSKPAKGTGLGLSIAKAVTERYGGEISVADRVEGNHTKGACFSVLLPKA